MKKKDFVRPTRDQVAEELRRERYKRRYRSAVTSTVYTLITVAAAAVLVATLLLPVLRIYGTSMTPTLDNGQIVVSVKTGELEPGDVVAFYYNNKILSSGSSAAPGIGWIFSRTAPCWSTVRCWTSPTSPRRPLAPAISSFPIKFPTDGCSSWATTGRLRWIPAAPRWDAWRRSRSWAGSFSGSGP